MANRAYLYSADRPDAWERPDGSYYDSRWTVPLAWWLFFAPDEVARVEVEYNGSRWGEVRLSAPKDIALARFAARRPVLLSLLGGGLGTTDVDQFAAAVARQAGRFLIVNPDEVLGGMSITDDAYAAAFAGVLTAVEADGAAGFLAAARTYVGELGAGSGGWECQVFGYTYAWDTEPGAATDGGGETAFCDVQAQ